MRRESVEPGSFWLDRGRRLSKAGPLEGRVETDVAVVGAGIAGASLARALVRAGRRVVLLEAAGPGRGATGRNAGFLLAEGAEGTAEVTRTHGRATAEALREAGLRTRAVVRDVCHGEPIRRPAPPGMTISERLRRDVGLRGTGSIRLAADAAEAADLAETARLVGAPLRFLETGALPPAYRGRGFVAGLVDPGDDVVDPLALLAATLDDARATGRLVEGYGDPVVELAEDALAVVRTPRAEVRAEQVVVTTNAWAGELLHGPPAVRPVRAQMLAARVTPRPAWDMPAYARRGADYWRTAGGDVVLLGGRRLVEGGATEETDDARPASPVQPALDALLRELVGPAPHVEVIARWAGTMAFTADGVPAAGRVPGCERTWVLAGCNGHGMGWAPGLASWLAAAMVGPGPGLPACFDPARAALARAG